MSVCVRIYKQIVLGIYAFMPVRVWWNYKYLLSVGVSRWEWWEMGGRDAYAYVCVRSCLVYVSCAMMRVSLSLKKIIRIIIIWIRN